MHDYMQLTLSKILILTIEYVHVVNITQYLNVYNHCNKDTFKNGVTETF